MKTLAISVVLAVIGALIAFAPAEAKGPLSLEVTGGGLDEPITIEGPIDMAIVYPIAAQNTVDVSKVDAADVYTLRFYFVEPGSGEEYTATTLHYFPPSGGRPAATGEAGTLAITATRQLRELLEAHGVGVGGVDSNGDGLDLAWFLLPSGIAGLVLLGGAGGRYFLNRRQ